MVRSKQAAFTLVELLVVITIIGMLMAILLPAVGAATESARAAQCKNRVKQIALAMQSYEARTGAFPGYSDGREERSGLITYSWTVAIMPDMERQDIYDQYQSLPERPYLDFLVCPSDPPLKKVSLTSYVANAGLDELDAPGCGALHTALPLRNKKGRKVIHQQTSMDKLTDGASNTILISENVQASRWDVVPFLTDSPSDVIPAEKKANSTPPGNVMLWSNRHASVINSKPAVSEIFDVGRTGFSIRKLDPQASSNGWDEMIRSRTTLQRAS